MIPSSEDRTLARQLSGAFVLFGGLVAVGFLITALAYGATWAWLTPELSRGRLAAMNESVAYAAMIDEENGLRGYLMTGDIHFLEAYNGGRARLAQANEAIAGYLVSDPFISAALLRTRLAEERWQERWARTAGDIRPGVVAPSMSEGKVLFDAYRVEAVALAAALNQRNELLSGREQRFIAARVILELAVFVAVLLLALRQHRTLSESIVVPVASLLNHIRRIRDGELEATAPRAGPHELVQLAEGLNEMVGAIAAARAVAESSDATLRDHTARLRQILEASREFSESLNLRYVVGAVLQSTAAVGGYEEVIVWLMDHEQKRLVNSEESATSPPAEVEMGHGLAGRAAKSGRTTFEGPSGQVRFGDGTLGPVRGIAIPLIVGARVVGALEARHAEARVVSTQAIEILEMLGAHAATAIESARLHEVVEERSKVDALTRLFNRRHLEEDLDAECKRCLRYGCPLTFVMLDVDHFKAFNDTRGHLQGDTALQEVAEVIAGSMRSTDTAYRYGGEEFCVLLRETSAQDGIVFAERLRHRIEQRFASSGAPGITASLGVAEFSAAEVSTPRAVVEAADATMYEAKHAGRNRVALSSKPPIAGPAQDDEIAAPLS